MFLRKYNTLTVTGTTAIRIPIIKRAVVDFAVGADWTPAAGDVKIAIDGAAAANVTNLPTAVAMGNTAYWEFVLTAAELTCKSCVVTIADSATKVIEDQCFVVETFGHASAMYQADLSAANLPANVTQLLGTAWLAPVVAGTPDVNTKQVSGSSDAADTLELFAGVLKMDTGQIDDGTFADDAISGNALATSAAAEIRTGLATAVNVSDAQTAIITQVDANETKIDAVKAKTDNLPSDPADQSIIVAATDAILSAVELKATQVSVDDLPTNAELATALGTSDDAVLSAIALEAIKTSAIQAVTVKLDTGLVFDGVVYQFTANMVELAPTGGSAPSVEDIRAGLFHADDLANRLHVSATGTVAAELDAAYSDQFDAIEAAVDANTGYLTSVLARLGAWTGTGVNTVLGAFKALLSKTATVPSDIGGTFDPAADSTEALRDHGDAAWTTGSVGGGGDNTEVLEAIDSMKSLIAEWIALNIPSDVRGFPATIIGGTDVTVSLEVVDSNNDPITEIFGESVETVEWLFGMGTSARRARIIGSVEWTSDELLLITIAKADTLSEDDGPRTWMIGCQLTGGEVKWVKTGVTRLIGRQFAEPTTTTTGA